MITSSEAEVSLSWRKPLWPFGNKLSARKRDMRMFDRVRVLTNGGNAGGGFEGRAGGGEGGAKEGDRGGGGRGRGDGGDEGDGNGNGGAGGGARGAKGATGGNGGGGGGNAGDATSAHISQGGDGGEEGEGDDGGTEGGGSCAQISHPALSVVCNCRMLSACSTSAIWRRRMENNSVTKSLSTLFFV